MIMGAKGIQLEGRNLSCGLPEQHEVTEADASQA
jgi:hypothetical protein